jgi:hypothetical protein
MYDNISFIPKKDLAAMFPRAVIFEVFFLRKNKTTMKILAFTVFKKLLNV